jgi:hypothetical protein
MQKALVIANEGFAYLVARGGIEPGWGYSIRLSNLLWPSSGGVKYPKYFFGTILNSVGNDARVVGYYQFSRAFNESECCFIITRWHHCADQPYAMGAVMALIECSN